jgi:hypothetical protein
MFRPLFAAVLSAACIAWLPAVLWLASPSQVSGQPAKMPDFPEAGPEFWINSKPLALQDLRGQVVLIEVWAST